MNLTTKTTLLYLLVAMVVFAAGGVTMYFSAQEVVKRETFFELRESIITIEKAIEGGVDLDALQNSKVCVTKVKNINPADTAKSFFLSDTLAIHPFWNRLEPHLKVTAFREINGDFYRMSVIDVFIENDDFYEGVVNTTLWLFGVLGGVLLTLSFLINRWLFYPFKQTLNKIRNFNLKKDERLKLPQTSTKEFKQLNAFVAEMTTKARQDYRAVKEFSENASHEMQTPLAIVQGKLELLVETPGLAEEQLALVQSAQQSLHKLSKMGEALLLLTKIENQEFATMQRTNFSKVVQTCVTNFEEIAGLRGLTLESKIAEQVELNINPVLADILVVNLVKNAIRHNDENGWIKVELTPERLAVSNAGQPPKIPTEQLFQRFQKSSSNGNSLGLGLSIVKKICEVSNWKADYKYAEHVHQISVTF